MSEMKWRRWPEVVGWLVGSLLVALVLCPLFWVAWNKGLNPWIQWHAMPWQTAALLAIVVSFGKTWNE